MTRTYHVASRGKVRRLDNFATPWVSVDLVPSISGGEKIILLDVETDPSNSDKVFAVGTGALSNSIYGIFVSTDAGLTWYQPTGNYQTNFDGLNRFQWYEVSVVDSNNIFVSGRNGYVAKSTDGGLTFNLTTQVPSLPTCTTCPSEISPVFSLHFITPNIGVIGLFAHVLYTFDAGTTWTILNSGNIITGPPNGDIYVISGIHVSADQQTIVALSIKNIFVSSDAGNTWTNIYQFSARNGLHLTWTDDLNLWAFGKGNQRARTTDGGLTWTTIAPYLVTGPDQYAGHFYTNTNGFFSEDTSMYSTNDGAITSTISDLNPVIPGAEPNLIQAVWTHVDPPTCYLLTDCTGVQAPLVVSNDLSAYIGQIIKICPEDIPLLPGGIGNGIPIFIDPLDQGNQEFTLTNCCDPLDIITILNNFGSYQGLVVSIPALGNKCWYVEKELQTGGSYVGFINLSGGTLYTDCTNCTDNFPCESYPILDQCRCFIISEALDCKGAFTLLNVSTPFPTCDECLGIAPNCYTLTDCANPSNFFVTNDPSVVNYEGLIVTLQGCPDICYIVTLSIECPGVNLLPSPILESFTTCAECNPTPPPTPVQLRSRMVKPGYDTPGCSTQYTEKISCNFAEQVFDEMAINRYGVTICCDHDMAKWEIKKDLLDLKSILDPNFIIPGPVVCTCYSIQAIVNTITFRYIDCEGCATTITVAENTTEYVCSQSAIEPVCPPANSQFLIINSETPCTTNTDCVTIISCFCYLIEPAKRGVSYSYYKCSGEYVVQVALSPTYVCAIENTVTIISNIGTITNVGDCNSPGCAKLIVND